MKGNVPLTKVLYSIDNEDFIVIAHSAEILSNWKKDSSIPLSDVVESFKIFTTHKQGAQGILDTASKGSLDSAFGGIKEDEILQKILKEGKVQTSETRARESSTNDSIGSMANHR